ncbi:MAG: DUF1846 family protein, partial [Clostridiaceae bacterium]
HEYKRGVSAGYSKFETFPVWNLPLQHPVNIAYEAATVDLKDINMIDSYHVEAYGEIAVNYNRDIETFPVLRRILEKISGKESEFKSPTDMGVNRVGYAITDDEVVSAAAKQEIVRRYFKTAVDYKKGVVDLDTYERIRLIMEKLNLTDADRKVVPVAREAAKALPQVEGEAASAVAIELNDGHIVTGKRKETMQASAAAVLNALKYLAGINDNIHLLSPVVLEPIGSLKTKAFRQKDQTLDLDEILIALSMSAATNPVAQAALASISCLRGANAHSTTMLNNSDENTLRSLGIEATSDPKFVSSSLFYDN